MSLIYAMVVFFGLNIAYYETLPTCTADQVKAAEIQDCAIS